jgi:hypothetical protein
MVTIPFHNSNLNPKPQLIQLNDDSKVELKDIVIIERLEEDKELLNLEVYRKTWYLNGLLKLPKFLRKPIAKTGFRTYSSSGKTMDSIISKIFTEPEPGNYLQNSTSSSPETEIQIPLKRKYHSVAVFVYMWVNEKYRGNQLGDLLLTSAVEICKQRGDEYMLLVHDDKGTGRLKNYYIDRGFVPIDDFIDKGMICKIN